MRFLYLYFVLLIFSACSVGVKLSKPQVITLYYSGAANYKESAEPKFLVKSNLQSYADYFDEKIRESLSEYNIQVSDNSENKIVINSMLYSESCWRETIDDTASSDYGQSYLLYSCSFEYNYDLFFNNKSIGNFKESESKSEEITNRRSFFEYLFGTNKDGSSYRHKELSYDIINDLSLKAAKHCAAKISRKINKSLKKG